MAKSRIVNTRFWSDNFVSELNPLERYLFLYFLTNEHTNISGIYELPVKTIAFESGLEVDMVRKMVNRLDGKVYLIEGWVYIKNFSKHQASENASVQKGIENALKDIPENIRAIIESITPPPPHPVPTHPTAPLVSESKLKSKSNLNSKASMPEWLDIEAWESWVQHRKEIKHSLTPTTIKAQLKMLEKNKDTHVEIINQSIEKGWTGLFPVMTEKAKAGAGRTI